MPRAERCDEPGAVHHVMMRGVDGRPVFTDDLDRLDFLGRLSWTFGRSPTRCLAWCLMTNHIHLVTQTVEAPLSGVMHRLNTGYAGHFNTRHDRRGYLFQSRFKSRPARDDADVLTLIRYVHRNPIEAGLVPDLASLAAYPWCGHGALIGRSEARPFHSVDRALAFFGSPAAPAQSVLDWMEARRGGTTLEEIANAVASRSGIKGDDLRSRSRVLVVCRARAEFMREAIDVLGCRASEVAAWLGVSRAAVSLTLRRDSRPPQQLDKVARPPG